MARAAYQVLVIPFWMESNEPQYCVFRRSDMQIWQFIAGGGEREDYLRGAEILQSAGYEITD